MGNGDSSAREHANGTRVPASDASGLMRPLSLEQTSPRCGPGLPPTPWVASGEAAPSSNLCLLICETGVTTPSVYASQGCKDHMRKFWSPQRLCFFLFSGDHPGQPTPPPPGSRHPYLAPQAPMLPETSR